jgi:glycosyltransferase involved in cell wall biosynthesis
VRVCIVYDCLYPYTIGGAERWYRSLAERLAATGAEVTYLTLRQWERGTPPDLPGVRVVEVGPKLALYTESGRRRVLPPLRFGLGVLVHFLRHGRRYDVVHTASFPYFSLLSAGLARGRGRFRILVDWHEVWTRAYWREYLGPLAGTVGWWVQRACLRIPQRAFCFSRLHERRLREMGIRGELRLLEGQVDVRGAESPEDARPVAVFAGRFIPEKRVPALVPALARAIEEIPDLRAELYGDGPERDDVLRAVAELGLDGAVSVPGFVEREQLERALASALCLLLPSTREGYGRVVVEASARGVPVVVVAGPDNAATELVDEGVNGTVASSAAADELAAAIVRVHHAGEALRHSTLEWFRQNEERLSLERSLQIVLDAHVAT